MPGGKALPLFLPMLLKYKQTTPSMLSHRGRFFTYGTVPERSFAAAEAAAYLEFLTPNSSFLTQIRSLCTPAMVKNLALM